MNAQFDPALRPDAGSDTMTYERTGYQRSRKGDPIATIAALTLALGTIGAFAVMHPALVKKQKRDATIVMLMELPDDPPPAEAPPPPPPDAPPPPPSSQIAAPVPLVLTPPRLAIQAPTAAPPVAVTPAPAPAPSPAVIAKGPENMGDLSAKMISAKPPRFPIDSRRAHEEGIVVLSVLLSTDGRVMDISVAKSSGFPRLDRAALDAVKDWRWSPLVRDGQPVMVRGMVTMPFVLQGGRGGRDGHGGGRDGHGGRGHHGDGPDGRYGDDDGPDSDTV